MELVAGRLGRAHGLRGEVTVEVRTDAPQERFVVGARFTTDPSAAGPLVLRSVRLHQERYLLGFEGVTTREAADALRGVSLLVDTDEEPPDDDAWYPHDLVGLAVTTPEGAPLGTVRSLETMPAQDLLVVRTPDGRDVLVPFVRALVPVVDVAGGRVVVDPPGGLFDDADDAGDADGDG